VSVYRPLSALFQTYTFFLVVWDGAGNRTISSFKIRKDNEAATVTVPLLVVERNYVIGESAEFIEGTGWTIVDEDSISSFLGVSGNWTLTKLRELERELEGQ
jgi:hypothetical protein